jgi:hypothetical protein
MEDIVKGTVTINSNEAPKLKILDRGAAKNISGKAKDSELETAEQRLREFRLDGEPILCRRFGGGHINDTYLVVDETAR